MDIGVSSIGITKRGLIITNKLENNRIEKRIE